MFWFDCPCTALVGLTRVSEAGPAVIEKALVTTSVPVVTVTVRPPVKAVGLIVMLAVAAVGLLTVTELTVMPGTAPKPTVVVPDTK